MIDLVSSPPRLYRALFPGALWRIHPPDGCASAYLTFDDGPIPGVTPWVLDQLDRYGAKATFFMVGDNARRHPELVREVLERGHAIGNHTMHHLQGLHTPSDAYLADVAEAAAHIESRLFRPPHGFMRPAQLKAISRDYAIVMHDVVSRDYDRSLSPQRVVDNVMRNVREGSIIVFHDSLKAWPNLRQALPAILPQLTEKYALREINN